MNEHLGRKPQDLDYGQGEHAIDCDRLGLLDETELTDRLLKAFEAPGYSPPRLPVVAMELMNLSSQPDVEFTALESVLEQDAMLAGEILSVARSAFFGRTHRASSLREALIRLGTGKLQQIVMQIAMNMRVFRSKTYTGSMEQLRIHSRTTAHLARIVSRYTPIDEEQAFMCGLLHDVGIAGILLALGDHERGKDSPPLDVLWPAIHAAHPRAGASMVKLWGLPEEFAMIVSAHHQVRVDGYPHPIAATVCIAEAIAVELGHGFVPRNDTKSVDGELDLTRLLTEGRIDRTDDFTLELAKESLGITDATWQLACSAGAEWIQGDQG